MKIAVLQRNPVVGDLAGNAERIIESAKQASRQGASWCMSSELALTGYPPKDLLLYPSFLAQAKHKAQEIAQRLNGVIPILLGTVESNPSSSGKSGTAVYNAALWCADGQVQRIFRKSLLPCYDVFDEARYFESGYDASNESANILHYMGMKIGVTICEDAWNDASFGLAQKYQQDPVKVLCSQGIDLLLNLSASPFSLAKQKAREQMFASLATKYGIPIVYSNQYGGNDELIFDGRSFAVNAEGKVFARAKSFAQDILIVNTKKSTGSITEYDHNIFAETFFALRTGLRDYLHKNGFSKVVLGLSGGIDSAVTATLARYALGKENVLGLLMPSPYSSQGSVDDALQLAKLLGIHTQILPIEPIMKEFEQTLAPAFEGEIAGLTEENLQARIRGNLLMAVSNQLGALLLATGNKSELAVGYCTLYGDMCGGLSVLSDLTKADVYGLAQWINEHFGASIPPACMSKPPSAELRPDQLDSDNLPAYDILDAILELHVEQHKGAQEIIAMGYREQDVYKILALVKSAEFKRKQAVPGLKIRPRSFGIGWRMPVAARFEL